LAPARRVGKHRRCDRDRARGDGASARRVGSRRDRVPRRAAVAVHRPFCRTNPQQSCHPDAPDSSATTIRVRVETHARACPTRRARAQRSADALFPRVTSHRARARPHARPEARRLPCSAPRLELRSPVRRHCARPHLRRSSLLETAVRESPAPAVQASGASGTHCSPRSE
jgi:hypothetical protein